MLSLSLISIAKSLPGAPCEFPTFPWPEYCHLAILNYWGFLENKYLTFELERGGRQGRRQGKMCIVWASQQSLKYKSYLYLLLNSKVVFSGAINDLSSIHGHWYYCSLSLSLPQCGVIARDIRPARDYISQTPLYPDVTIELVLISRLCEDVMWYVFSLTLCAFCQLHADGVVGGATRWKKPDPWTSMWRIISSVLLMYLEYFMS